MKEQIFDGNMFCDTFPSNLTVSNDRLGLERRNECVLADINYLNKAFSNDDHKDVPSVTYQVGQEMVGQEVIGQVVSQVGQEVVGQEVVSQVGQEVVGQEVVGQVVGQVGQEVVGQVVCQVNQEVVGQGDQEERGQEEEGSQLEEGTRTDSDEEGGSSRKRQRHS